MVRKTRVYLCEGCLMAPDEGVVDGMIRCKAAEKKIDAVLHTKGRRFESCEHRKNAAETKEPRQAFLLELAKEARKLTDRSPANIAALEERLKKKHELK